MRLHVLGARGSTPAPGGDFAQVGGHTSCIAIAPRADSAPTLVLDAGTGIRSLDGLLGELPFTGTVVLTHLHWDHLMGLPFASCLDRPGARIMLLVPSEGRDPTALMGRILGPPFFPVTLAEIGRIQLRELHPGPVAAEGFAIDARWLPHGRGRAMGLRVTRDGVSIAYIPDHDGRNASNEALWLARDVDLLLHDAQFGPGESAAAARVGHSTVTDAAELAERAGAGRLLLIHHDPGRSDVGVDALTAAARRPGLEVAAAREGDVIDLGSDGG